MNNRKKSLWLESPFTGIFHCHSKFKNGHSELNESACLIRKLSSYKYETAQKFRLDQLTNIKKICVDCLEATNQTTINNFKFFKDIPNIEENYVV